MARKLRIHYPTAVYHVILRGNAGSPIFFDDKDRYRLYLILQYAVEKFGCKVHAFCLMSNHIHLVIQVADISLARIMQNISLRFTQWINYSHSRTGHLFQGRYKALLIDADTYLLELVRYIHLNPIRAGIVKTPAEYPWSSHRGYLGLEFLPWLTTDFVFSFFSQDSNNSRKIYETFVNDGLREGIRDEFYSGTCEGRILGDDTFANDILGRVNQSREREYSLADLIRVVCTYFNISEEKLRAAGKIRPMTEARAVAAAIVQISPHLRLTDLANLFGRDLSAMSKAAKSVADNKYLSELAGNLIAQLRDSL